jgi:hypothetical protein
MEDSQFIRGKRGKPSAALIFGHVGRVDVH